MCGALEKGSAGINFPGICCSFMLNLEKFSSQRLTQAEFMMSTFMVCQLVTVVLSVLTVNGPCNKNLENFLRAKSSANSSPLEE